MVDRDSIPPELIKVPTETTESVLDVEATEAEAELLPANLPALPRNGRLYKKEEADFKLDLVQRVRRETQPGTPERAALIRELAATVRYLYGAKRGKLVGANTIRRWINEYEKAGFGGVFRKEREDSGKRRLMVSRKWDAAVASLGLADREAQRLADELERYVASLWRSGTPSGPTVQRDAQPFAIKQLKKSGCTLEGDALKDVCCLPRNFIERQSHFRAVALYRQNAGRSAAIQTPRIRRSRDHLGPMEWVAGDVHHIDIAFQRDDGSMCTVKAVAWMDLATNRAHITPFVMPKGEMIRREHVIESFVAMCTDRDWGAPSRLYLDRGGEYNFAEFAEDLCKLKHQMDVLDSDNLDTDLAEAGVHRSRAYNPQSKVIETLFSILERCVFSHLPGHIGGDRMKKKTENQGKAPTPYPGDFEDFKASLKLALDYYHGKTQRGHLKGKTPNQRFNKFIDDGWRSILLDTDELAVAFCTKEPREVRAGGMFSYQGKEYRHDDLISLAGFRKVLVGKPLFGGDGRLFLFTEEGEPIGIAEPVDGYAFGDIRGSGEQKRQNAIFRRKILALEDKTDSLDLQVVMRDVVDTDGPAPNVESRGVVSIDSRYREVAQLANDQSEADAESPDEYRQKTSRILDQLVNG